MRAPFFSIIVVALNAEKMIGGTIESILNQSFSDYEIIVKDGCSRDNTLEEIPESDRIKTVIQPDQGIYDAMNQAIGVASGKYICFMNCGDRYHDNAVLQKIFNTAAKQTDTCNVIYSDFQWNDMMVRMPKKLYDFYLYLTNLNHQSIYIGKAVFKKYGLYDLDYQIKADYEYTLRTYKQGVRYIYCECVSCDYLGNGVSASQAGSALAKQEYPRIIKQYFSKSQLFRYRLAVMLSLKKLRRRIVSEQTPLWIRKMYRGMMNQLNRF